MKQKILPWLTFSTGLLLSGVAGFFSIVGLATLFAASFWSVVVMGTTLEVSKLVAVSWLYNNWNRASLALKSYLFLAILVLMIITSMGIFGYLSKAHIDQKTNMNTGISTDIEILKNNIKVKEDAISDINKQISVIDSSIDKMLEKGQAKDSLKASDAQKKKRDELVQSKNALIKELSPLKTDMVRQESEHRKIEAELGPIKYLAEWYYGEVNEKVLDMSVRYVILILIVVFDPLAVFLLIAFNVSMRHRDYTQMEYVDVNFHKKKKKKRRRRRRGKTP